MAYKEIVTKAVIGKGKKKYNNKYQINVELKPTTILGCWIINHNFHAVEENGKIIIKGSFDVNVWYSYDNDTKTSVAMQNISYTEEECLVIPETDITNKDIIIRSLKQPVCISAKEDGNIINLEIEKELGIEIVGDTKVKISLVEEEETWDILDNKTKEQIDKINPNYVSEEIIK